MWLGGEEVRRSVIESVASADYVAGTSGLVEPVARRHKRSEVTNDIQVIYDCGREFVREKVFENA